MIFSLIFATVLHAKLVTVDVSSSRRCDPIYNPPNCVPTGTDTQHKANLRKLTGIDLGSTPAPMPEFGKVGPIKMVRPRARSGVGSQGGAEEILRDGTSVTSASQSADPGGYRDSKYNNKDDGGSGPFDQSGGDRRGSAPALVPPSGVVGSSPVGGGKQLVGGMLYSDEDEPKVVEAPKVASNGLLQSSLGQNPTSAVDLNRENNSSSSKKGAGGAISGSSGSSPFGQFQSGGGGAKPSGPAPESDGGLMDRLKKYASNLLNGGFLGLGAGKNSKYGRRLASANGRAGGSKKGANTNVKSADVRGILQNQLNKYRGLASKFELAGSNTNLFGHLCEYYKTYSVQNQIPNPEHSCPK